MVSKKRAKQSGSTAERELLQYLYSKEWGVIRAAGSGSAPIEVPDVLAGKNGRILAIEIKYCTGDRQYISAKEKQDLEYFALKFGAESWIAVKFSRRGWHLVRSHDLKSSGKNFVISYEWALKNAKRKEEL